MIASLDDRVVLIVGGGKMGEALLAGLLAAGRPAGEIVVAEVSRARREELDGGAPGCRGC